MRVLVKKKSKKKPLKMLIFLGWALLWILSHALIQMALMEANIPVISTTTQLSGSQTTTTTNMERVLLDIQDSLSKTNVMIQLKISESTMEVGSGTIIDVDDDFYYVITNEHVIRSMGVAISYKVITSDGIQSLFELLHHDAIKDLAIIRFPKESRSNITPIAFSNMESEIDEFVISIGNPYGSMGAFTMGSISSYETLTILNQEAISHTAVLARGSSGGALVNIRGQLLGINTWGTNSVFYAIPLRVILTFLASTTY